MTAVLGINTGDTAHVQTDAATTSVLTGDVVAIGSKQIVDAVPGALITPLTKMQPTRRFAELAVQQCADFDALVVAANDFWSDAKQAAPPDEKTYGVLFAGWSQKRNRPEIYVIDNRQNEALDYDAFAAGPTDDDLADRWLDRFDDLNAFDPQTDGLAFMQAMRQCRAETAHATFHAVGGFVEHARITREGISRRVIHVWPDELGRPIDLDRDARVAELESLDIREIAQRIDAGNPNVKGIQNA